MKTRIVVVGSTGMTGLAMLKRAVQNKDIEVTAFVRTPSKVPAEIQDKVKIVIGNILNPDDVSNLMKDQDVVVSCLGKRRNNRGTVLLSQGTKNIVEGMRRHNVKYLHVIGWSILLPGAYEPPRLLTPLVVDVERMMEYIKSVDDICWVATMAPIISNGDFTGDYKVEVDKLPGSYNVTKYDLADWMITSAVDQLKMEEYKHKCVGISSMSTRLCILL